MGSALTLTTTPTTVDAAAVAVAVFVGQVSTARLEHVSLLEIAQTLKGLRALFNQ